jgi:acetyl-CoA acyltransferase 1
MASDPEVRPQQTHGVLPKEPSTSPLEPSTPLETGPPDSSQITLPSTEIPQSPIDPNESFKTEVNDDRGGVVTVIPSSLTPPPSTQVTAHTNGTARRTFSNSQQAAALHSPPATIMRAMRDREIGSGYEPPSPQQVLDASADQLRAMLQTCIGEHQRLKMETAHYKLQNNLLGLQADEDSKRAAVEHEMIRREVDALRTAEHSRQAKRELSTASETNQAKYLQMRTYYEAAVEENEMLNRRFKVAKKLIKQKEEENLSLQEEKDMLLTRIRENREHFNTLCSPGGIFHSVLTPTHQAQAQAPTVSTPQQHRPTPRQVVRSARRDERDEHGLSALLQAVSQDHHSQSNNNSAPSTPLASLRPLLRAPNKHHRNSQSMSSLPTTPLNRLRVEPSGLLPSIDLVPQTEPARRHGYRHPVPTTPLSRMDGPAKSRESTISVDDTEELARQALQSFTSRGTRASRHVSPRQSRRADPDVFEDELTDSQATQAATEMLRRDARQSFEVAAAVAAANKAHRDASPDRAAAAEERSARLLSGIRSSIDKRKFSGHHNAAEDPLRREPNSPAKKMRASNGDTLEEQRRVGLGIQYSP